MASPGGFRLDEIGRWSEIKLEIVQKYARAYSTIFSAKGQARFRHIYIDAFAGAGANISKETGRLIPGSPLNALYVLPPFDEYFLIDLDGEKLEMLRELVGKKPNVHTYQGDCNKILLEEIFPQVRYDEYKRALCLLDPYGLHLTWPVIEKAGRMKTIDMFLNFPVMDMNRNVLWRVPEKVSQSSITRMDAFWGDDSWRKVAYKPTRTLFGMEDEKAANEVIAEAFRKRLNSVAGFESVPEPVPMTNRTGAILYYLFFASQKKNAAKIASDIFRKCRS